MTKKEPIDYKEFGSLIKTIYDFRELNLRYTEPKEYLTGLLKKDKNTFFDKLNPLYSVARTRSKDDAEKIKKELSNLEKDDFINLYKSFAEEKEPEDENIKKMRSLLLNKFTDYCEQWCGGDKKAKTARITSLVSKYAYYVTGYNFPVLDGNAKEVMDLLYKKYDIGCKKSPAGDNKLFFETYYKIAQELKKSGYKKNVLDSLDAFFWSYKIISNADSIKDAKRKEKYFTNAFGFIPEEIIKWYKEANEFLKKPENKK